MDIKTFGYLYYKIRGLSGEDLMREAELSSEEYHYFEQNLQTLWDDIEQERPQAEGIGERFVRFSRYIYESKSDQEKGVYRPDAIKARAGELVSLPATGTIFKPDTGLSQIIEQRKSLRKYSTEALSKDELSYLLWATSWAKDFRSNEKIEITLRNVPSAGARHPFETYLQINRVAGIKPGLYYYHPIKHCLVMLQEGEEISAKVHEGCFHQEMLRTAAVNFIWTAVPYRTVWRYGQRGYRYLYLDAGHVGQNLHLATEAIGSGACMIGAFLDELMNDCIGCDGNSEFVIYIGTVGKKE